MPKPYSYDLRQKVIQAIALDGMRNSVACQVFNISRNTIDLWLKRQAATGDFQALPNLPPGNGHKITDWEKLGQFALVHGEKTLFRDGTTVVGADQLTHYLKGFEENWLQPKKKTYGYRERDQEKRQAFIAQLSTVPPCQVVYIDESGMDGRDEYDYGWNERGHRFHSLKSGRRTGRVNMIAAWCNQNLIAPLTIEGPCNRTVFETWLENCLLTTLVIGQVVVMDNATFHKGGRIERADSRRRLYTAVLTSLFSRPQ